MQEHFLSLTSGLLVQVLARSRSRIALLSSISNSPTKTKSHGHTCQSANRKIAEGCGKISKHYVWFSFGLSGNTGRHQSESSAGSQESRAHRRHSWRHQYTKEDPTAATINCLRVFVGSASRLPSMSASSTLQLNRRSPTSGPRPRLLFCTRQRH